MEELAALLVEAVRDVGGHHGRRDRQQGQYAGRRPDRPAPVLRKAHRCQPPVGQAERPDRARGQHADHEDREDVLALARGGRRVEAHGRQQVRAVGRMDGVGDGRHHRGARGHQAARVPEHGVEHQPDDRRGDPAAREGEVERHGGRRCGRGGQHARIGRLAGRGGRRAGPGPARARRGCPSRSNR